MAENEREKKLLNAKLYWKTIDWAKDQIRIAEKSGTDPVPTIADIIGDAVELARDPAQFTRSGEEVIQAEQRWHQMLDLILSRPDYRKGIEANLQWAVDSIGNTEPPGFRTEFARRIAEALKVRDPRRERKRHAS